VSPRGLVIDAVLELNGKWQAEQTISGATDPNSGGNVVFLSPGMSIFLSTGMSIASNRWSGFVTVGLPIINDLNGLQSEPTYRLFRRRSSRLLTRSIQNVRFGSLADIGEGYQACPLYPQKRTCSSSATMSAMCQ
jgi:hypothetical protein